MLPVCSQPEAAYSGLRLARIRFLQRFVPVHFGCEAADRRLAVPLPGFGQGVSSMQALLTDPGVSGRATAALLLGKDKGPATRDALQDVLLEKDWSVRAAAVHALALRDDPARRKDLGPLLDDDTGGSASARRGWNSQARGH